jgi:hypothetical protein
MKSITDIFIRHPVLAVVVNLVPSWWAGGH